MTNDRKLPLPPEFPASNASYNKIVDKMHKAALNATTCAAAITAVSAISAHVTGVNTYSKKCRRYGEELIAALEGKPVEYAINDGTNSKGEPAAKPAKAKRSVPYSERKVPPSERKAIPLGKSKAQVIAAQESMRSFSSKSNAKRALKAANCDHLPVEWELVGGPVGAHFRPILIVADDKGASYAQERGFAFKVTA